MPTKLEARVSEHDRQIAAIRKLILQGMKMINSLATSQRELAASQRKTDAQLQAFIQSLQRGRNGHAKLP
ncbi:MAG: hypothetical protein ACLQU1_40455 [Bryobacteraceae bacterium]